MEMERTNIRRKLRWEVSVRKRNLVPKRKGRKLMKKKRKNRSTKFSSILEPSLELGGGGRRQRLRDASKGVERETGSRKKRKKEKSNIPL